MNLLKHILSAVLLFAGASSAPAAVADTVALASTVRHESGKAKKNNAVEFTLDLQLPASRGDTLYGAVREWAFGQLAGAEGLSDVGTPATDDELADRMAEAYMERSKEEIGQKVRSTRRDTESHRFNYAFDFAVRRVYETGGFITFVAEAYDYAGEAGPRQRRAYATFRKSDGHRLTWDDIILSKQLPAFSALVADGLQDFFGVVGFDALRDRLAIDGKYGRTSLPLPQGGPGLVADGIRVQYDTGEIAPGEAGQPLAIVSYTNMRGMWTKGAVKLWRE